MKILVLGSGAREHAILASLAAEDAGHDLLCAPGNAGIAQVARTVAVDAADPVAVAELALGEDVALVVIGPEAPLVAGVADALRTRGIATVGPSAAAAAIEGSKAFAKRIMAEAVVPTGRSIDVLTSSDLPGALDALGAPHVVKADGLAAGKGVLVTTDRDAAFAHGERWLAEGPVVVEEFLDGPEVSLFVLSDGHSVVPLAPAQDFKRLGDGDEGPNTGGMGAYSPLPWLDSGFVDHVVDTVARPVVRRLADEQTPFIGVLYCGLIVTDAGVRVIEFNARFGDPETQVVLARLVTPLSRLLLATATGGLGAQPAPVFREDAAVTVVLASEGYPAAAAPPRPLAGLDRAAALEGVQVLHAATRHSGDDGLGDGAVLAAGGRVLSVVGLGATISEARERAYAGIREIALEGGQYRSDIAARV